MTERLIIGNLKMQWEGIADADAYIRALGDAWQGVAGATRLVVCPPFPFLERLRTNLSEEISVGAQDIFWQAKGAYTGEVSASMLRSLGVEWVLVGHSERRQYLGETESIVAHKLHAALEAGLTTVLCVGETAEERDQLRTKEVILTQLEGLSGVSESALAHLVIAYEPRWAIGSGQTPTTEDIQMVATVIRAQLREQYGEAAVAVRLVYGGSVSAETFSATCQEAGMDGVLVGRESLSPESLLALYRQMK